MLNICFSYTSTHEITSAIRHAAIGVEKGVIQPEDIDFDLLEQCLYTHSSQPVDLLIRTSGEIRLSDFLLWQTSTSCLAFIDVLWPEFSVWDLYRTMLQYQYHQSRMMELRREMHRLKVVRTTGDAGAERVSRFLNDIKQQEDDTIKSYQQLQGSSTSTSKG